MHRIVILINFVLLAISAIGFENHNIFPGPLLALLGIFVVLSSLASPMLVWFSAKDLLSIGVNKTTLGFLFLSVVFLVIIMFGVFKVWPQLMSV